MRYSNALVLITLAFSGCANHAGVTPSQNSSLGAISPSTTAASSGGAMQKSLDSWLKEEWIPTSKPMSKETTTTAPDGTIVTTKTEDSKIVTTTTAPDGTVVTTTAPAPVEPEDTTPFTLQKYVDKWKVYNENKAKINEGKPKELSHIEKIESMPIIGK